MSVTFLQLERACTCTNDETNNAAVAVTCVCMRAIDANRETLDYLRYLCPDVHVTRGVFDDVNLAGGSASVALPERKVVSIAGWRIGLSHGHDVVPAGDLEAAAALQRQMDCDVLVLGNTHAFKVRYRTAGMMQRSVQTYTRIHTHTCVCV